MTTEQILAEVDGLTDANRVLRMTALGHCRFKCYLTHRGFCAAWQSASFLFSAPMTRRSRR